MREEPWHLSFLEALDEVADTAAQRRAWVEGAPAELPAPDELVCQIFDDSGVGDSLEEGAPLFSPEADAALAEMLALLPSLDLEAPPAELLADPTWTRLAALAKAAADKVRQALAARP